MLFTGVTRVQTAHGIYDYVMDSDGDIVRRSSLGVLLVADVYVILDPYEMFVAVGPKTLGSGTCYYFVEITLLLYSRLSVVGIVHLLFVFLLLTMRLRHFRKRTRKTTGANT